MKITLIFLSLFFISLATLAQKTANFNAKSVVSKMSAEEKISFISGYKNFNISGIERLGIPMIKMADGPMGIKGHGKATAFPASICMAASWNPELIKEMSGAMATEAKSKGIGVILAPGVNMYRVPQCGRNFEYYGEDPFLSSQMAVAFITGIQEKKVMATVKHFIANNQDYDRHRVSSDIDERTLHEIYFPVFKAAVEQAHVGAVMTSYNLLNGIHTSESSYLIKDVLKGDWNFDGIVMSDWISVYSFNAFKAGLDIEMPRPQFMNSKNILPLLASDPSIEKILNDKVERILNTCHRTGLYDKNINIDSVIWNNHKQISKQVAREGFVLLKNEEKLLPLGQSSSKRILVLGPNALYTPYSGGGAAMIDAYEMTSYYKGIKKNAPAGTQVDYLPVEGMFHLNSDINKKDFIKKLEPVKNYDAVVLCVGFNPKTEGEGFDRPFDLPKEQRFLIKEVTKNQKNTILVVNSGGGIFMPWIKKIKVLLYTWYPGQDGGSALGEILFGKVNPSGKLPISIERQWKDNAAYKTYDTIHAVPGAKPFYTLYGKQHPVEHMKYEEGIFTGYRHYDTRNIEPQFHFGFGLSYTSFELSGLHINKKSLKKGKILQLELSLKNTGKYDGAETVQLYIHDVNSSLPRPVKELKAFEKVFLKAGETQKITFNIDEKMLRFYHPGKHQWITEKGDFEILIGNASNNILLKQKIKFIK